jgi:RNA ligase (TIGR02306 family)
MSTFAVTVEKLRIYEHPNADVLELAEVGKYRAVVRKDQFQDGDYALYIPEQAVLPPELLEELGLTGKLAGRDKNRVKAIRLRGELSQGIVCRPKALHVAWGCQCETGLGDEGATCEAWLCENQSDLSQELGITKWEPPIPTSMAGKVEAAPRLLRWPDIENIKRYPNIFEEGEEVVATEKIHGTCFLLTYSLGDDEAQVTSKGQGSKNLALVQEDTNLYWRAAYRWNLPMLAAVLCEVLDQEQVGLFGEVFGKGVQDLHYGTDAGNDATLGFVLFDIAVQKGGETQFLDAEIWDMALTGLPDKRWRDVPTAPVLYRGPYDYDRLAALAEGKEQVSGRELHIREGLVVRPAVERRSEVTGGRAIAKFVSDSYLLRGNATEYE